MRINDRFPARTRMRKLLDGNVVNLIGGTTTQGGLAIRSALDEADYPTGRAVTDEQMDRLSIKRDAFHGEWNYRLLPRSDVNG